MILKSQNKVYVRILSLALPLFFFLDIAFAQSSGDVICSTICAAPSGSPCKTKGRIIKNCHTTGNLNTDNNADIVLDGNITVVIDGDLLIRGTSALIVKNGAKLCVKGNMTIQTGTPPKGVLDLQSGGQFCVQQSITNEGQVFVRKDAILEVKGNFINRNDNRKLIQKGGRIVIHGDFDNQAGGSIILSTGLMQIRGTLKVDHGSRINVQQGAGLAVKSVSGTPGPGVPPRLRNGKCQNGCALGGTKALRVAAKSLPVELLFFRAVSTDRVVKMEWKTALERNSDYFNLYRSFNGESFEKIYQVKGQGTTQIPHAYHTTDQPLLPGTYYYQLEQVDEDGKSERFPVKKVKWWNDHEAAEPQLRLYPMPIRSGQLLFAQLPLSMDASLTAKLFNLLGRKVAALPVAQREGRLEIQLSECPPGIYLLQLNTPARQYLKKIEVH